MCEVTTSAVYECHCVMYSSGGGSRIKHSHDQCQLRVCPI